MEAPNHSLPLMNSISMNNDRNFAKNSNINNLLENVRNEDVNADNDMTLDIVEMDDNIDMVSLLRDSSGPDQVILPSKSSVKKKRVDNWNNARVNRTKHKISKKQSKWNRSKYNDSSDSDYEEESIEYEKSSKVNISDLTNLTILDQEDDDDDDLDIDIVNFDHDNTDLKPLDNINNINTSSNSNDDDDMYIEPEDDNKKQKKKRGRKPKQDKHIMFIPYMNKIKIVNRSKTKFKDEEISIKDDDNINDIIIPPSNNDTFIKQSPPHLYYDDHPSIYSEPIINNQQSSISPVVYKKVKHREFTSEDVNSFYESLKPTSQEMAPQPEGMVSTLFPYQKRAVSWMVKMEKSELRGGILADEMGLGKTVEVLGTILHHSLDQQYYQKILPATLIVCPSFLVRQWKTEIKKHCPNLNTWIYKGVSKLSEKWRRLHERNVNIFMNRDIIISSFEVLCKDLNYTLSPCVNTRRSLIGLDSKKVKSPLVLYNWWRVCIDEAQMHSNTTTKTAKMLLKIPAIHRWVVSGTPIKRGFNDLKGLLTFLGCENQWYQETDDLIAFLKTIMWRHSKNQVIDDVSILETIELNNKVNMVDLELFSHRRLFNKLKSEEVDNIDNIASIKEGRFSSVPHYTMCQYYFNFKGNINQFNSHKVTESLTNTIASEFYQLQIALGHSINQYGDYLLLHNRYEDAIKAYQLSYDLNQYNTSSIMYKKLIQLKTSSFVLSPPQSTVSSVCYHSIKNMRIAYEKLGYNKERDESLKLELLLQKNSLQTVQNGYMRARENFKKIKKELSRMIRNRNNYLRDPWYIISLKYFEKHRPEFFEKLRKGVEQQYDTKFHGLRTSILQLNVFNAEDLIDLLERELTKMYKSRERSNELIMEKVILEDVISNNYIDNIEESEKLLNEYEMNLASLVEVQTPLGEYQMRGELNIAERILLYIEYMTILEYNPLITKYSQNMLPQEYYGTLNELSFAVMMAESHFRELEIMKLEVDRGDKLIKEKARYIKAIRDLQSSSVAQMSHVDVLKENIQKSIHALLEKKSHLEFIVNEGLKTIDHLDQYGSKLGKAARLLHDILIGPNSDPKEKALVFSAWTEPLIQLSRLLDSMNIQYRFGQDAGNSGKASDGTLKDRIEAFQTQDEIRVLFLNSLSQSTGLTLTQANHVLLLDPIDPSSEKQAIGRAYRIGQQKNTYIYRFHIDDGNLDFSDIKIPEEVMELLPQ